MSIEKNVTDKMLEEAYRQAATITRDYGDVYLPIFKRLHEERVARHAYISLKELALQSAVIEL